MGNDFKDRYKADVAPLNTQAYIQQDYKKKSNETRYTAQKGTAVRAKKGKKTKVKLAAMLLAASIGVGGITLGVSGCAKQEQLPSITEMQENGVDLQRLDLSETTIGLFEKYDEYFENFDPKNIENLTEENVMTMIGDVKNLHMSTVKEKIGSLKGVKPENVEINYNFEKGDGRYDVSILVKNEAGYSSVNKRGNSMSDELKDTILQLEDLSKIEQDVGADKLTKVNAVKELKKLYQNLEQVATGEFVLDEKENISIIHYDEGRQQETKEEEKEID